MMDKRLSVLVGCVLIACGGTTTTQGGEQNSDAAPAVDMSAPVDVSDMRVVDVPAPNNNTLTNNAMSAMDMGTGVPEPDMRPPAELDMGTSVLEPDMAPPPDPIDWPMYSGEACDVDGVDGVCLPTAHCGGRSVSGHCPGPSDMQCCIQMCDPGTDQPGRCAGPSSCSDWAPSSECVGPTGTNGCCAIDATKGDAIGTLWNTYYYLSNEDDHSGPKNTALNDSNCNPIVNVSSSFSDAVCIEGSGKLSDGRVINYAKTCSCGRPCPTGGIICYSVVDKNQFPWGKGARSNPLEPLRSLAVDRSRISLGTVIYLEEFDGYQVPVDGTLGGFVHDGCFRADDVGGAIQGSHIDIFSGTKSMYLKLNADFPTRTDFTAYKNASKCLYLQN